MKVDILAFAAHPDDIEISSSGTLLKHIQQGKTVAIVDLTQGELGSRGNKDTRREESKVSSEILGLTDRVNLKMADGFFEHNEANLRLVIEQIRHYQPEIILANAVSDRHPDHPKGSKLVSEACFLAGLIKIETNYQGENQKAHRPKAVYHYIQDRHIEPDFVVDVSDFVEQKIAAIKAYKTQFFDPNSTEPKTPISGEDFFDSIYGRMSNFGRQIGVKYAEGFTVERYIGVNDLFDLI
jgi:bacillithiol biosynthesis deacetylase BshB1